ncbi:MAG: sulfatase-like hydrolase/transferase [Gemmatimonadaceae bacterium]
MTNGTRVTVRSVVALVAVTGLATGLLHALVLLWRLAIAREFIWQSRDHIWMAPLAYLCFFLILGVPGTALALLVQRRWRGFDAYHWLTALFLFASSVALLLLWPRLHPAAVVLLAMGAAVRGSTILVQRRNRDVARVAWALAATVLVLGAGSRGWRAASERRWLARLPEATADAPNILLIILDTVRAASTSLHGYGQPTTPFLERLGADGVVFDRAITTSPWTLPSHGSLFTGHDADALHVSWRVPLDAALPTLAEVLTARGYATAAFVANTYYAGHDSGLERGFAHYDDYRTSIKQLLRSTSFSHVQLVADLGGSRSWRAVWVALRRHNLSRVVMPLSHRKNGATVTDDFLRWQGQPARKDGTVRPFFAFLNYFDAHEAYAAPPGYDSLFAAPSRKQRRYEGAIRFVDDQLARLFDTLSARGVLDNTIVVVTSDHGEQFGEHGKWGHGNALFMEALHVPLLIRYPPRVPRGARVRQPVSLRDIGATMAELSGAGTIPFPGRSLSREWNEGAGTGAPNSVAAWLTSFEDGWLPIERQRTMRSLVVGDWHWIRNFDGSEALHDFRRDPGELNDVWSNAAARAQFESERAAPGGQ